ncbi:MAG: hypothetical protein AB1765_03500 [Candidatus Hydrogenedentota bacterium]
MRKNTISFRTKLLNTLKILKDILPHTIIIGSEVPNLIRINKKVDLFVSEDIDVGIPVLKFKIIKSGIKRLLKKYYVSRDEPSILCPKTNELLEINFLGIDKNLDDLDDVYIFRDGLVSFIVFGTLSLIKGKKVSINGMKVILAEPASLLVEKLLTERSHIKGERDIIVAGLLLEVIDIKKEMKHILAMINALNKDKRYLIQDNLSTLILITESRKYDFNTKKMKRLLAGLK